MDVSEKKLPGAAIAALQMGKLIEAIKVTRQETGLDLKGAKDLVDAYVAKDPVLRESLQSQSSASALGWIVMVILILAAIFYFFPK